MIHADTLRRAREAPYLDETTERALVAQRHDRGAADQLVLSHLRLVVTIAREYPPPTDDAVSEGTVALVEAVERFDPSRSTRLGPYAGWWIRRAVRRHVTAERQVLALSADADALLAAAREAARSYRAAVGADPSPEDLAAALDVDGDDLRAVLAASLPPVELDADDGSLFVADTRPSAEQQMLERERQVELRRRLLSLNQRERAVVVARASGRPLRELAPEVGLSHEGARKVEHRALALLGGAPFREPDTCRRGHSRTESSPRVDGSVRCRPCDAAGARARRRG